MKIAILILAIAMELSLAHAEAPTRWTIQTQTAEFRFKEPLFVFDGSQISAFIIEAAVANQEPFATIARHPDNLWIRAVVEPEGTFYLGGLEELVAIGCSDTLHCIEILSADCTKPLSNLHKFRPGLPWSETRINGKDGTVYQIWCAFDGKCDQIESVQLKGDTP